MTIHFAPALSPNSSPVARALNQVAITSAANDNGHATNVNIPSDQMLRSALRHFAEHGLGAARDARAQAEQAFFAGDQNAYEWWLGITRTLDRRLAAQTERSIPMPKSVPEAANETHSFTS